MARKQVSYTVDVEAAKRFNELAKKKNINRSSLISEFMEKWVKANK